MTPLRPCREGLEALDQLLALGARLIGVYPNGAYIASGEDFSGAFTDDPETVRALRAGHGDRQGRARGQKISCFRFCPARTGMLCLDIDRGHGNRKDGVEEFYALWEEAGRSRCCLPTFLQDIGQDSFPVYTTTPRGGYHLFFRYHGPAVKKGLLAPNVEVFHTSAFLTAPGSVRDGRPYVLHGNFADAPELPPLLRRRLLPSREKPLPKAFFRLDNARGKGIPSLEQLAVWAERDRSCSGRNELCFEIARRAAREDYPYAPEEVVAFLASWPPTAGHRQIRSAVRSAFRYRKK